MSTVEEQQRYYRAVANQYEDHSIDAPGQQELLAAIDAFRPEGEVLELACGPGRWTDHLLRYAQRVTAVDGAPEMLARARNRVGPDAAVEFVCADLFEWKPTRRYDAVVFGFWISHVPDERFESFWSMLRQALKPDGTVFFFDDNYRPDHELIEGPSSPVVERKLHDGTAFRVIKMPYTAAPLESRLRTLDWDLTVTEVGNFYWGTGTHRST